MLLPLSFPTPRRRKPSTPCPLRRTRSPSRSRNSRRSCATRQASRRERRPKPINRQQPRRNRNHRHNRNHRRGRSLSRSRRRKRQNQNQSRARWSGRNQRPNRTPKPARRHRGCRQRWSHPSTPTRRPTNSRPLSHPRIPSQGRRRARHHPIGQILPRRPRCQRQRHRPCLCQRPSLSPSLRRNGRHPSRLRRPPSRHRLSRCRPRQHLSWLSPTPRWPPLPPRPFLSRPPGRRSRRPRHRPS
jgi:hypothetical protein